MGNRAVEYMGVTNDLGRDLRASFPLERELLRYCSDEGIRHYDLGGIDPHENPGCHRFKRGTGACELEYLGEWDWATSEWFRVFCNWAIMKRQTTKHKSLQDVEQEDGKRIPILTPIRRLARHYPSLLIG